MAGGTAKYTADFLDQCAEGFTSKGQVAFYQACIGRAMAYVQELRNCVATARDPAALGPGNHQIPFMVRDILLLCFSCLDSSIHLLKENGLLKHNPKKDNFMASFAAEDFTDHNGDLFNPWKDVAEHYALDDNGNKLFKTNHLWNTLKHYGMLTMSIITLPDGQSQLLKFNKIEGLNVVTFLDDFCDKVKAWVDKLSEKIWKL